MNSFAFPNLEECTDSILATKNEEAASELLDCALIDERKLIQCIFLAKRYDLFRSRASQLRGDNELAIEVGSDILALGVGRPLDPEVVDALQLLVDVSGICSVSILYNCVKRGLAISDFGGLFSKSDISLYYTSIIQKDLLDVFLQIEADIIAFNGKQNLCWQVCRWCAPKIARHLCLQGYVELIIDQFATFNNPWQGEYDFILPFCREFSSTTFITATFMDRLRKNKDSECRTLFRLGVKLSPEELDELRVIRPVLHAKLFSEEV